MSGQGSAGPPSSTLSAAGQLCGRTVGIGIAAGGLVLESGGLLKGVWVGGDAASEVVIGVEFDFESDSDLLTQGGGVVGSGKPSETGGFGRENGLGAPN